MNVQRKSANTQPIQGVKPAAKGAAPAEAHVTGKIGQDTASFSRAGAHSPEAKGAEGHGEEHSTLQTIAHKTHYPHAAGHVVEAGEVAIAQGARVLRGARAVEVAGGAKSAVHAAEHAGHGHAGLLHKLEAGVGKLTSRVLSGSASLLSKLPGGSKLVSGIKTVAAAPGRLFGSGAQAADSALAGTRLGNAVRLTGSGGRFVGAMGGRLPIVGAVLGPVIAAFDLKTARETFADPKATRRDKIVSGTTAALSVTSGALGVGALAVAGAVAVGLTAPVSVPLLLAGSAITGAAAFAVSFFRKSH